MNLSPTQIHRSTMSKPAANLLLAALSSEDLRRWQPQLGMMDMPVGMVLMTGAGRGGHVYFPTTASVSMQHVTYDGDPLEVTAVGNEGLVGISTVLGGGSSPGEAVVRMRGQGYRLSSEWLQGELRSNAAAMRLMLRYVHAFMTHTAQSVMCNRHHCLEQRLCWTLLRCLGRLPGSTVALTHESLACMLGMRRAGVTCAALELQRAGLIEYARGIVVVRDRAGLEARSCDCYAAVRDAYKNVRRPSSEPPSWRPSWAPA